MVNDRREKRILADSSRRKHENDIKTKKVEFRLREILKDKNNRIKNIETKLSERISNSQRRNNSVFSYD